MSTRAPWGGGFSTGPFAGPPPRDIVVLLAVVFVTFTLRFFAATAVVPGLLSLTPAVWHAGYLWQLVTYPFVGFGGPDLWFLLELLVLYWFGADVWRRLGRRRFWQVVLTAAVVAGVAAVFAAIVVERLAFGAGAVFILMQGQRTLLVVMVAAFATISRGAVILLFFVLPVRAGWLLWLTVLFAFVGFLATRDLAGFTGLVVATAATWAQLVPGGPSRGVRRRWLELRQRLLQRRLDRLRRRRGLRVVRDDDGPGPTIH